MANVIVDKNKIDILANAISNKSGEPVTMTLDEMVEAVDGIEVGGGVTPTGNIDIISAGVTDVTNYATATVANGSATASATKGAVSNHSVTVTPSVTTTAGYVTAGTSSGTAVTVSASELVSGSQTITINDTYDVTNLASVTVAVSGGSGYVWQDGLGYVHVSDDADAPTLIAKSITQDGTYDPATDGADGYSYVTVNVGGGGGGSDYTPVYSTTIEVNTTSTTAITVATLETGDTSLWTSEKMVYVKIRDKAGGRNGYFYGCDAFLYNHCPEFVPAATVSASFCGNVYSQNANGWITSPMSTDRANTSYSTRGNGVYPYSLSANGDVVIQAKYGTGSIATGTINGTFSVDIYLLNWPNGIPPYQG